VTGGSMLPSTRAVQVAIFLDFFLLFFMPRLENFKDQVYSLCIVDAPSGG
jgi:hypothetical protein